MSNYIVGLTGGVGSGKSKVADLFVENGAGLVDTDAIAHELTGPNGVAMSVLVAGFFRPRRKSSAGGCSSSADPSDIN